jgi:hypothetical protein
METLLRRSLSIRFFEKENKTKQKEVVATILKNIESLGYTFEKPLIDNLMKQSEVNLRKFYIELIPILKNMKGADKQYAPMYPNFPEEVMNKDSAELYLNAIMHYLGDLVNLRILPDIEKKERFPLIEKFKLSIIKGIDDSAYKQMMEALLGSKTSLSPIDQKAIEEYVLEGHVPSKLPFKENLAFISNLLFSFDKLPIAWFKSCRDVLRLAVAFNNGDVSLATNTKFKLNRKQRKFLIKCLNTVNLDDLALDKEKWIKLGEVLHVGEFKAYPKVIEGFRKIRENVKIITYNSEIESHIKNKDVKALVYKLKENPGYFARRLGQVLLLGSTEYVEEEFSKVVSKVETTVLLQVKKHFSKDHSSRAVFPKGNAAKMKVIKGVKYPENNISSIIEKELISRFSKLPKMGKVKISEKLRNILVPFSQRSSSNGINISRGSKLELGKKNTIRFFIWWKDNGSRCDLDLSAIQYDKDFKYMNHISWTNLKSDVGCHSGDITSAPNGACEFIDINLDKIRGRYIVMNVNSYTGQKFSGLQECYAGYMMRNKVQDGEIFDPRTVEIKIDVTNNGKLCLPMIIDTVDRKVIWVDLGITSRNGYTNTIENNERSISSICKAMVNLNKTNVYELLELHVKARGELVDEDYDIEYNEEFGYEIAKILELL